MILRHCMLIVVIIIANITAILSCVQKGSLAFVIDDTKSMEEDISKVRNAVDGIMDIILNNPTSQIKDVVLVTFNDPNWLTKLYPTKTRAQLKNALRGIKVHGGGDCPEYSLTGIIMALENSLPNSYLFVFTDAPPKDTKLIAKVTRIAQSKGSQIIFVRTPGNDFCRISVPESKFKPYYDIAAATFGQVFMCGSKKEVEDILHYVNVVISGCGNTIKVVELPPNKRTNVPFNVDDQSEYVVVSASGIDVELDIIAGPTKKYEKITWINNAKVLKIDNPEPGDYIAAVKGTSTTSILVFARTDFTFQHGFSEYEPPAFNNDKLQPTDGTQYHLLVNVSEPSHSVYIKSAEFLTQTGDVILRMPLRKKSDNYYITDPILSPNSLFLIAIKGVGKKTGKELRRVAKTPVHSRPKNKDPIINISQPGMIPYNGKLELSCSVNAYPKPEIVWKDANGKTLPPLYMRTYDINRYTYVSKLTIDHLKKSQVFFCYAENSQGESKMHVDVTVQSPFITGNKNSITTTVTEYGQPFTMKCDIHSSLPMQITWYYNQKEIGNSIQYAILNGGTELKINKATEHEEGIYKCKAWLRDDKDTTHELTNIIKTNGLAPVLGKSEEVSVRERNSVTLKCNIIRANPRPKINWQFKKTGASYFQNIAEAGQEFKLTSSELQHSGVYKCIAQNPKGTGEKETKLSVLISPKMILLTNNHEVTSTNVEYSSKVTLICRITSHSQPKIIWKNSKGDSINPTQYNSLNSFEYNSYITIPRFTKPETYYCEAFNEISKIVKQVHIEPNNPIHASAQKSKSNIEYGKPATLLCNLKSDFGMKITWYRLYGSTRKEITNSVKYNILKDESELQVNKVEESIEGKYVCKASLIENESVTKEHVIDVIVNPAAPVMGKSEEVSLKEKNPITLKCNIIQAYPRPEIRWQFKKTGETDFHYMTETGEEFRLTSAELQHSGVYKCVATNSKGASEKEIKLTVLIPPKMTLLTNNQDVTTTNVEYSSMITLSCHVISHSVPNLTWKNSRGEIITSSKYIVSKTFEYTNYLTIPRFTKPETYYCEAFNEISKTVKKVHIEPINPIRMSTQESTASVENGKPATLLCDIKSDFGMKITWYRLHGSDRKEITNTVKYNVLKDGFELQISKVEESIEGKYVCKAALRENGSVTKEHVIDVVINPAAPVMGKSEEVSVKEKNPITLKCNIIQAYPRPKIDWQFKKTGESNFQNIAKTGEEFVFTSAELQHSGFYKCIAHNFKGTSEKETKVNVLIPPKLTLLTNDQEVTTTKIEYSKSISLTCRVQSHIMPNIIWKNKKGDKIATSMTVTLKTFDFMSILNVANVKKDESYYCEATNDITTTSKSVTFEVTNPLHVKNPETITKVRYGEKATIKCDIMSSFPTKYFWSVINKAGKTFVIQNSDKYSISTDGSELVINKMEPELNGRYICKATLKDDDTVEQNHKTTVTATMDLPEIEIDKRVVQVREGSNAVLKCKILKGNPRPNLVWLKSDDSGNFKTITKTEELLIELTKYQDAGLYKCVAINMAGKTEMTAQLTVEGPPAILSDEQEVIYGVEGDLTLNVPCVVTGHPKPIVSWLLGDSPIVSGDKYIIEEGSLVINNPKIGDSKKYTCSVKNNLGEATKTFETTITNYIDDEYLGNITYVYMLEGETKKFDCYSGSRAGRWFIDSWPDNATGTLTLSNVTSNNDGNYTCRTSDRRESKSHTYIVDVGYAPKFDQEDDNEYINWQGNDENLDCSVDMKPENQTVEIKWLINGNVSSVTKTKHPIIGWGNYTCEISNYHGQVSKSMFVYNSKICLIEKKLLNNLHSPLIMDTSRAWPQLGSKNLYLSINNNAKLIFSCHNNPKRSNSFKNLSGRHEILAVCDKEDKFLVDGKPYMFSEFECVKEIEPMTQRTGKPCAPVEKSEIIQVGYSIEGAKNDFLEAYNVCFDTNNKVPLYSRVTIRRPQNYNSINQTLWHRFEEFNNENSKGYCDDKCCLEWKQMVNSLDVRQGPAQSTTYIEVLNTLPVWNCKKDVNWDSVGEEFRSTLQKHVKIDIWAGAHEYTRNTKANVLVPRYLWKLTKLSQKNMLAVVLVNDPSPTSKDILCNTPCKKDNGVGYSDADPYTFCCSLAEFRKHFVIPDSF